MKMKRIILLGLLPFVAAAALARTADIKVSYEFSGPSFRDEKASVTNRYILLANSGRSKFYSPTTQSLDSLESSPEGKARLKEMQLAAVSSGNYDKLPRRDGKCYVEKSFEDNRLRHYDVSGLDKYVYEEATGAIDWQVGDSTRVVLGYECVMATAAYHGRTWTVWFAPEIPVHNGPWKFDGLPGLILEAADALGQYRFTTTGIQQTDEEMGPVYLADQYEQTSRIDYLKARRSFMDNPIGKINATLGGQGIRISVSGDAQQKALYLPASVVDFIETDYH